MLMKFGVLRLGRGTLFFCAFLLVVAFQKASTQSLTYSTGQDISPAYEGWEQNDDGTASLVFGYMNRNWREEIDVPVGPENSIEPGGPDQGQPTHFLPRRNRFVFRIRVPKDFGDKEIVWTLVTHGQTNKAYASLRTDYRLENIDLMSETGALGAGTSNPEVRSNQPPVVKVEGSKMLTAKVGQPITVSALVTDDGIPRRRGFGGRGGGAAGSQRGGGGGRGNVPQGRGGQAGGGQPGGRNSLGVAPPSRITVGKVTGLHAGWFVYRGAGIVTFSPDQIETWEDTRDGANSPWSPRWTPPSLPADGKWVAQVTFDKPGTYVLRCVADDGGLFGSDDVTVRVTQ